MFSRKWVFITGLAGFALSSARPVMNTHLRLNMSPSRPPTSSKLPNARA